MKLKVGKDTPFGVLSGVMMILVFYVTLGLIVAYIILNAVASQTHTSVGFFANWWQILLFVLDIILLLLLVLFICQRWVLKPNDNSGKYYIFGNKGNDDSVNKEIKKEEPEDSKKVNKNTKEETASLLAKLEDLHKAGILTDEEYIQKIKEIK